MISSSSLVIRENVVEKTQLQSTNIDAFEARYQQLKPYEVDSLKCCEALKQFLPNAIEFLKKNNEKSINEDVAHYLMGTKNYLPTGLNAPKESISHNEKTLLHDLLRTHRYGVLGKKESREHTITKLESLNDHLFGDIDKLEKWVGEAKIPDESKSRSLAKTEIENCIKYAKDGNQYVLMRLNDLKLTSIPPIPRQLADRLSSIDLSGNLMTSLNGLPAELPKLETLKVSNNTELESLKGMPSGLPNLRGLELAGNPKLASLNGMPSELPELNRMEILNNGVIKSLQGMPNLPKLVTLSIEGNANLESLEGGPAQLPALAWLDIGNNSLKSLEHMPQLPALKIMDVSRNKLESLEHMPQELPMLSELDVSKNQIGSLEHMPHAPTLTTLDISSNQLASQNDILNLRQRSPDLAMINAHGNLLPIDFIETLNRPDDSIRDVGTLDEELRHMFPKMDTAPWTSDNAQNQRYLATLLNRLGDSAAFQGKNKTTSESELLSVLKGMRENPGFREYCYGLASGSSEDCSDNVQSIFNEMRLQLKNPATKKNSTLSDVVNYYTGCEKIDLISKYVATLPKLGEPLESAMLLQHELCEKLQLPINYSSINFRDIASVNNDLKQHKKEAIKFVENNLKVERVIEKMIEEAPAIQFLEKTYPTTFVANHLLWEDAHTHAQEGSQTSHEINENASKLEIAKKTPYGTGGQFQDLYKDAKKALHREMSRHAFVHPGSTPAERESFEIQRLVNDPDWQKYVLREDVKTKLNKPNDPNPLHNDKGSIAVLTKKAIAAEMEGYPR